MESNHGLRAAGRVLATVLRVADATGIAARSAELHDGGRVVVLLEDLADLWHLSGVLHADRRRFRPGVQDWTDQDARPLRACCDHEHRRGVIVTLQAPIWGHVRRDVQHVHSIA